MLDLSNIYNLNDKKVYILLKCWGNKKKNLVKEEERLYRMYGNEFSRNYDIAYNLCSEGYLYEYNNEVRHNFEGIPVIIQ